MSGTAASQLRLARTVGLFAVMASAVAGEYGAGINFVAVQSLSVYPGVQYLVPVAMAVTGLVLVTKVFMFARFSRVMPRAGSAYVWIVRSVDPLAGFIAGFLWWISLTAAMGFIAFAFSTFLGNAVTGLGLDGAVLTTHVGRTVIGLAAIWGIYTLHAAGVKHYGTFVSVLLWLIVGTALTITLIGFSTTPEHFITLVSAQTKQAIAAPAAGPGPSLGAFVSVCALFIFAYGGVSAAPSLGGETRDAERTVPSGLVLGWLVALVLYTLVAAALLHAAPWWAIVALVKTKHAGLVTAPGLVSVVAPHWVGVLLNLVVAVIVGKTLGPQLLTGSRLLFAFGQDRLLPESLAGTSHTQVPAAALRTTAILASLFLLQSVFVGWSLGVVIRSLSVLIVWGLVGVGALMLRAGKRGAGQGWAATIASDPWMPIAGIASIVICVVLFLSIAISPNTPLVFQPLFQTVVATVVAIGLYLHARSSIGRDALVAALATPPAE
jgi:basic amino acid/polyamine antiporter, APA family